MTSYFGKNENVGFGDKKYHVQTQFLPTGKVVCMIFEGGAVRVPKKEFDCAEIMYDFDNVNLFAAYVHRKITSEIATGTLVPTAPEPISLEQKTETHDPDSDGVERIVVSEKEALAILLGSGNL